MRVLLDTCTFIWMAQEPTGLSTLALDTIDDRSVTLFLSDISKFEVVAKHSAGKLLLNESSAEKWFSRHQSFHRVRSIPLNDAALYFAGKLPRLYRDPFDRQIAAVAIKEGMTILSPDTQLSLLGASRIW